MARPSISPQAAAKLGWSRVDPKPWSKTSARWEHRDGWKLAHCGHPTALTPWALFDSDGTMHCTGGLPEHGGDIANGTAWATLAEAMNYVAGRTT